MKIAVVGAGISGLVAAHRLSPFFDVDVYESERTIGGHTHTVDVEVGGERRAVDMGFIVFNRSHYPRFAALLDELGVASKPTSMSFGVRCDDTGLEYRGEASRDGRGVDLDGLFAQRRNLGSPRFWRLLRGVLRFRRIAREALELDDRGETVGEFVERRRLGSDFADRYLIPLGAALWSCPPSTFRSFPMRFVAEFLHQHSMLEIGQRPVWRVVDGGSRGYLEPLSRRFSSRIRRGRAVRRIRRAPGEVWVETQDGAVERYDHVVLGVHADTALRMLDAPRAIERSTLAAFPYQRNVAILHTDASVLPDSRRAWASWNCRVGGCRTGAATITYLMNRLQGFDSPTSFCVTLNDDSRIDPRLIIERWPVEHPLYTPNRTAAQSCRSSMIDLDGISYCGAYWGYGFHEDGVRSAHEVADRLISKSGKEAVCAAASSKVE
ncbi:MAG: FAD-dependent oxidoreductase [Planctomycetes bacterium]|nr:FAD-dependent oxidoreductase [Planctomycetota bacterium]